MANTLERIIKYLKKEKVATAQLLAKALDVNIKTIRYWIDRGTKERILEIYPVAMKEKRGKKTIWGVMLPKTFEQYIQDLKKIIEKRKSNPET
jgi:predicted transcriptional regulator